MMWRRCCGNDHQRGPVRGYRRVACGIRLYQPLRADTPVRITTRELWQAPCTPPSLSRCIRLIQFLTVRIDGGRHGVWVDPI